jgi:hypothetical protein
MSRKGRVKALDVLPTDEPEWFAGDLSHEEWMAFVARGLWLELSEPGDDIYTLEDGEPPGG